MSHAQEIGFCVISQGIFYVNIPTSGLEVIPHFTAPSEQRYVNNGAQAEINIDSTVYVKARLPFMFVIF